LKACERRTIDGLLIVGDRKEVDKVLAALALIRDFDPIRYKRIARDLARIWVMVVPSGAAQFRESTWTCEIDDRFVLDPGTGTEILALVIVHEATHARLHRMGIPYEEKLRDRIERICIGRELAFAAALPNGGEARHWAERGLASVPADMSNKAMAERSFNGWVEAARYSGFPEWLINWAIARRERRDRRRAAST